MLSINNLKYLKSKITCIYLSFYCLLNTDLEDPHLFLYFIFALRKLIIIFLLVFTFKSFIWNLNSIHHDWSSLCSQKSLHIFLLLLSKLNLLLIFLLIALLLLLSFLNSCLGCKIMTSITWKPYLLFNDYLDTLITTS